MTGIFKAYDIRGIYPSDLNEDVAYRLGRAIADFLNVKNIVIGRDMRLSSDTLFSGLSKGLTEQGCNVIDIGLSSSDMFYFAVGAYDYDGGVMITASHNPGEWNGFKIVRKKVVPVSDDTGMKDIERIFLSGKFRVSKNKGKITKKEVLDDFVKEVRKYVDIKKINPFKVVMDAANGMAGMIAPKIFEGTKLKIIPMCFELDGSFPHHKSNPLIEENRKFLVEKVKSEKADLGIAWDGDTDRCFFVDDTGYFVQGDYITGLIAETMLKKYPGGMILYDLRASFYVPDIIKKNGGRSRMCRVGHAFFKQYMRDESSIFAGEVTGHYYYRIKDFYADNGWIPALQILELMSKKNKKLSELLRPIKNKYWISGEINFEVRDKDAAIKRLEEKYNYAKKIYHLDGLSVEYDDWHFNVRPSNTESLLRLNLEAKTKEEMEGKVREVSGIIKE